MRNNPARIFLRPRMGFQDPLIKCVEYAVIVFAELDFSPPPHLGYHIQIILVLADRRYNSLVGCFDRPQMKGALA